MVRALVERARDVLFGDYVKILVAAVATPRPLPLASNWLCDRRKRVARVTNQQPARWVGMDFDQV
jgi:hypothetical protein